MRRVINTFNADNRGFTLVELLVVIAILGAIMGVMAMTISMVLTTTSDSTARNLTMSQVNQAASWIARDIGSADDVTFPGGSVLCKVIRKEWNGTDMNTTRTIVYEVTPDKVLLRKLDGSATGTPIAQFISYHDPDTYTAVTKVDVTQYPAEQNTYIIKLRSVYSNGEEYRQQYKVSQIRTP